MSSRGPTRWSALLAILAAGCASGELDAGSVVSGPFEPGPYQLGGQTGSLVPDCGVAPLTSAGQAVPAGDVVALVYADDCLEEVLAGVAVTDSEGNALETQSEVVDAERGIYLLRSTTALSPGRYALDLPSQQADAGPGGSAVAEVATTSDLPTTIGQIEPLSSASTDDCSIGFALTPSAPALSYAPLLRLEVSVDDGPWRTWVEYGALDLVDGRATLELPRCAGACLEPGTHRLALTATVAGESTSLEPLETTFAVRCGASPPGASQLAPDMPADDGGCALSRCPTPEGDAHVGLLTALALLFTRRRRAGLPH